MLIAFKKKKGKRKKGRGDYREDGKMEIGMIIG
jgi:hypothetical protein